MKKILDNWALGIEKLFFGYAISLYSYLAIALAGLFYIWTFVPENALTFTVLIVANIFTFFLFGRLKYKWGFSKKELIVARMYLIVLAIIFIIGCLIDFVLSLILLINPILFAGLMVLIRDFQDMRFINSEIKVVKIITKLFSNNIIWLLAFVFVIISPFAVLFYALYITLTSKILMIAITLSFLLFLPFVTWIEACFIKGTIFDIAFSIAWSKEAEDAIIELHKLFETLNDEEFVKIAEKFENTFIEDPSLSTRIFRDELQNFKENNKKSDK